MELLGSKPELTLPVVCAFVYSDICFARAPPSNSTAAMSRNFVRSYPKPACFEPSPDNNVLPRKNKNRRKWQGIMAPGGSCRREHF
jgi:hypothetical protein